MTIDELIHALTVLKLEHGGDVPVLHHDDWNYFLVETVTFIPHVDKSGDAWIVPAHVEIEGDRLSYDGSGGLTDRVA